MGGLNFGQWNVLRGALLELALQSAELVGLLKTIKNPLNPLAFEDLPSDSQQAELLEVVNEIQTAVKEMCTSLEIELDPIRVRHKVHSSAAYMKAVIGNIRPEQLKGYGSLNEHNQKLLRGFVQRISESLQKL